MEKFYLCGGAVRDELLGKKPKDKDFVVLANSFAEMRSLILKAGGSIFVEKPEYQTIRGKLPNFGLADFALPRKDGEYSDGRRPDWTEAANTLYEDSCRRDFTINAMYKNLSTNEIVDYHNGLTDLKNSIISSVGDPRQRFQEDYLRILRAIRFFVVLDFSLSSPICDCLKSKEIVEGLKNISVERVREELVKAFRKDSWKTMFILIQKFDLVGNVIKNEFPDLWFKPTLEG